MRLATLTEPREAFGRRLLAALMAVSFVVQCWLLFAHWINADEGAHLMDVSLLMQGLMPGVDFNARQPLYVLAYAPFLAVFGEHYEAARLMPLLAMWLTVWLLYVMARRLWGTREAWCAAALYVCAPTVVVNASVVKTEPLAVLLTTAGIFSALAHLQGGRLRWMAAAGVAFGMGYYVRESTMAGLLAATVLVFGHCRQGAALTCRRLALLYGGYVAVCLAVVLTYATRLPMHEVFDRKGLTPLIGIWSRVSHLVGWLAQRVAEFSGAAESAPSAGSAGDAVSAANAAAASAAGGSFRMSVQTWELTVKHLTDVLRFNAVFLTAAAMAAWLWMLSLPKLLRGRLAEARAHDMRGITVLLVWLASTTLLYAYHVTSRGFFQYYFREFLPPIMLLSGWMVVRVLQQLQRSRYAYWTVFLLVVGGVGICAVQYVIKGGSGIHYSLAVIAGLGGWLFRDALASRTTRVMYAAGCVGLLGALLALRFTDVAPVVRHAAAGWYVVAALAGVIGLLRWCARCSGAPWRGDVVAGFAGLALLCASTISTATYASMALGLSYDSNWAPSTVRRAAHLLRERTGPGDDVLSGGVIWEFEAQRRPFLLISHPLGMESSISQKRSRQILQAFDEAPPKAVVLDGVTEITYVRWFEPQIRELLRSRYTLVERVAGSKTPVDVYIRDDAASPEGAAR